MRSASYRGLTLAFLLISLAHAGGGKPCAPPDVNTVGRLVKPNGEVSVNRPNVRDPLVAGTGFELRPGDQIKVGKDSSVRVVCFSDFRHVVLQAGDHGVPCAATSEGTVLDRYPKGRTSVKTLKNQSGTTLAPKANDYRAYLVEIIDARPEASGTSISLTRSPLLSNDERQALVTRIQKLNLDEAAKQLLLADVYAMNGLYRRSISALKAIPGQENEALIKLMQGDLYLADNKPIDARAAYAGAAQKAASGGDLLGEAHAQQALGMLHAFERVKSSAVPALNRAIELYTGLGETEVAARLRQLLDSLTQDAVQTP